MKKFFMMALALVLVSVLLTATISLTACKKTEAPSKDHDSQIADALEILNKVWGAYGDEEKFPAIGGDTELPDGVKDGAPGKFPLKADLLTYRFVIPEKYVAKVEDAASLSHMMNSNTFTAGAFRLSKGTDIAQFSGDLKDALRNNRWMCGFPQRLVILSIDDYVVSAFGAEELIHTFKAKVMASYPQVKLLQEDVVVDG